MLTSDLGLLKPGHHRLPCPTCDKGARDTALSVLVLDCLIFWRCWRCGAEGRGRRAGVHTMQPRAAPVRRRDDANVLAVAAHIWKHTVPLAGTQGADYLARRHCVLPPAGGDLRFHRALYCAEAGGALPALVAKVTTVAGNRAIGVHRIWIRPGESRAVAKRRLGGCAEPVCIRLWPDDTVTTTLGIAEGVETALAAAQAMTPLWATIDCGQMQRFPVLAGIESLTIFADYDAPGMAAANAVHVRYHDAGKQARRIRSQVEGEDFNDVVRRRLGGRQEVAT